jgi:hypothetical protein
MKGNLYSELFTKSIADSVISEIALINIQITASIQCNIHDE